VKVELGLARGKRKVDKRAAEKEKDWKRDKARLMRNRG
jgi:SsrA-binding protein